MKRREFLKKTGSTAPLLAMPLWNQAAARVEGDLLSIRRPKEYYQPLDEISIKTTQPGLLKMIDGNGSTIIEKDITDEVTFKVGGKIGGLLILLLDEQDRITDYLNVNLKAETQVEDEDGEFSRIFSSLRHTLSNSHYSVARQVRCNGKLYHYFSSWMQDHMYAMLGSRYFFTDLKSGTDLYVVGQREDGMFHDNYKHAYDKDGAWSWRFDYGNFVHVPESEDSSAIFVRVPVENIAEFTFIEMLYETWKAVDDDNWMMDKLDNCLKAVEYATSDPYRWSEDYQLLKRGYTIDIWDFQATDATEKAGGDTMRIYLDKSPMAILYADNLRFAQSCRYLGEMLRKGGRTQEAAEVESLGSGIRERIKKLSWNGRFYRHMVPLDPDEQPDFGDTATEDQVTMSNTWILNRGASQDEIRSIIQTYQGIKLEMPKSSPGEWYCCYPPFERGYHTDKWNYMNGGVSPIAAGELARASLEHGFEEYGVDILRRVYALAQKTGNFIKGCYKGKLPDPPERSFTTIDLRPYANCDLVGDRNGKVPGWTGEGDNDLRNLPTGKQQFHDIPVEVIDPASNDRKACLGISLENGYSASETITIDDKATSLYFFHTMGRGYTAGRITIRYTDGSEHMRIIAPGKNDIGNWWFPSAPDPKSGIPHLKVGWRGANPRTDNVGVYLLGINNPDPDKKIKSLKLDSLEKGVHWMILGITLCDAPVFFMPSIVSTIPDHWAAAECIYGLMEGLVGIKNPGKGFNHAEVTPRWDYADKSFARATAHYPASNGYVSYNYKRSAQKTTLWVTGNGTTFSIRIPIGSADQVAGVRLNQSAIDHQVTSIEKSRYATIEIDRPGVHEIEVNWI